MPPLLEKGEVLVSGYVRLWTIEVQIIK